MNNQASPRAHNSQLKVTTIAQHGTQYDSGLKNRTYVNPTFQSTLTIAGHSGNISSPTKIPSGSKQKPLNLISSGEKFVSNRSPHRANSPRRIEADEARSNVSGSFNDRRSKGNFSI